MSMQHSTRTGEEITGYDLETAMLRAYDMMEDPITDTTVQGLLQHEFHIWAEEDEIQSIREDLVLRGKLYSVDNRVIT